MKRLVITALMAACFLAARADAADAPETARHFSDESLGLIEVNDLGALAVEFRKTSAGKLWREESVQEFLRPLLEASANVRRNGEAFLGLSFDDVLTAFRGRVSLALLDLHGSTHVPGGVLPEFALVARVNDRSALDRLLARLDDALDSIGAEIARSDFLGVSVVHAAVQGMGAELGYVATDRAVFIAVGPDVRALARAAGGIWQGQDAPLASNARFAEAVGRVDGRGEVFAYIDAERSLVRLAETEAGPGATAVAAATGLDSVRYAVFSERVAAPGFLSRAFVGILPGERRGVFKFIADSPIEPDLPRLVPESAGAFLGARLDLAGLQPMVMTLIDDKVESGAGRMASGLLLRMGAQMLLFSSPVAEGAISTAAAGLTAALRVERPDEFEPLYAFLTGLATGFARNIGRTVQTSVDAHGVQITGVAVGAGLSASMAYFDRHLLLGFTPAAVTQSVGRLRSDVDARLLDTADYRNTLARVGVEPGFFVFYRAPAGAGTISTYLSLAQMFKPAILRRLIDRRIPQEIPEFVRILNFGKIPTGRTLAAHDTARYATAWLEEEGVGFGTWGSGGVISTAAATGPLAAAVAPAVLERIYERAGSRACSRRMTEVLTALLAHAERNGGALPANLDELGMQGALTCPTSGKRFAYVAGLTATDRPTSTVIFELPEGHNGGVNVGTLSGNVSWRRDYNWVDRQVNRLVAELRARGRQVEVQGGTSAPPEQDMPASQEEYF